MREAGWDAAEVRELVACLGHPPRLDWLWLGVGEDGHVASLFPGSPLLDERRRLERELDAWSAEVASYLEAALAVARRAAAQPARAPAIWRAALDQEEEPMRALSAAERDEVERLGEAMEAVYAGALELAHDSIEVTEIGGQDARRDCDAAGHWVLVRALIAAAL